MLDVEAVGMDNGSRATAGDRSHGEHEEEEGEGGLLDELEDIVG